MHAINADKPTPPRPIIHILSFFLGLISFKIIPAPVGTAHPKITDFFKKFEDNKYLDFVPGHPVAGLEKSGPEYGFSKLFENRYCIVTPIENDLTNYDSIISMWGSLGMKVEKIFKAKLSNKYSKVKIFTHFVRCFIKIDNKGLVQLEVLQGQQSNRIKSFVKANCWGIFPEGKTKFKKGDIIEWVPLIPGS